MKKFLSLMLVAMMVVALAACGGSSAPAASAPAASAPAASTPAAPAASSDATVSYDKTTITLAHGAAETTSMNSAALKFEELVEAASNGDIQVELYPNQQMGGDREFSEAVSQGNLSMGAPSTSNIVTLCPTLYVFDAPFVFTDRDKLYAALDGPTGQKLLDAVREGGLQGLGYWENGFRELTTNKEIKTLADLKGVKIRVMENEVHLAIWTALGANPSPLAFGEVYQALQTKTFDAQENPLELIYNTKFYEVQPYVYMTNHIYTAYIAHIGAAEFDGYNADTQALLKDCMMQSMEYQRGLCKQAEADCMAKVNESGVSNTYDVDAALLGEIKGALGGVYDLVKERSGNPDLVEEWYALAK